MFSLEVLNKNGQRVSLYHEGAKDNSNVNQQRWKHWEIIFMHEGQNEEWFEKSYKRFHKL